MWSEEEMREIPEVEPERRAVRSRAGGLRRELAGRNLIRAANHTHELTRSSVVYAPAEGSHGNFIDAAYRRIVVRPEWARRLGKAHTAKRQARPTGPAEATRVWNELDTATSSDALLMNIFCYPRVLTGKGLTALLGIPTGLEPEFGYHPAAACADGLKDRSEIDMRLGSLLVEAKLTENDFQAAPMRLLERYAAFDEVFDREMLEVGRGGVRSYQLVRGVLAAHAEGGRLAVLLDARRPDLLESWFAVMRAVRSFELQARLRVVTWQEISRVVPRPLRQFLEQKYGIAGG